MELKKQKLTSYGREYEACELRCTNEEYKILREFLESAGVNLCTSVFDTRERKVYIRNPYEEAVGGWGSELCKKQALDFFERYKKH